MNFIKRLKALSRQVNVDKQLETLKFEKHCPHCSNRGMFVFRLTNNQFKNPEVKNEKN